jgi:hypothetical protein
MSHVTIMPLRKQQHFFGQDCLTEKLAHAAIEHDRLLSENDYLRKLNSSLAIALHEAREQIEAMGIGMEHLRQRAEIAESIRKGSK